MGIIITKYEDSANNSVTFDSSKFDYGYNDDSFPTDALSDIDGILKEHGDIYHIERAADTTDSMGHVTATTQTTYVVYGMFQDITIKDRKIHEMGLAVPGNRKFYMMPNYSTTSAGVATTYEIKEGDIITDDHLFTGAGSTGQWRVVSIIKQWYQPNQEIYRIAIVKSINLDGS